MEACSDLDSVSLVVGLLVEPVRGLLVRLAGNEARERWFKKIDDRASNYISNPERFTQYLIGVAIRLLITSVMALIGFLGAISIGIVVGIYASVRTQTPAPTLSLQDK